MDELCYLCLAGPAQTRVAGYDVNICSQCWRAAESERADDNWSR